MLSATSLAISLGRGEVRSGLLLRFREVRRKRTHVLLPVAGSLFEGRTGEVLFIERNALHGVGELGETAELVQLRLLELLLATALLACELALV